jgi:hypothetical protein
MMRSVAELLEREGATVDLQGDHFERMLRRRDRRRRNQRIAVYALVGAFAVVAVVIGIGSLRGDDEGTVIPGSTATPTAPPTATQIPALSSTAGPLEPGTYVVSTLDPGFDASHRITITVPDGYESFGGFAVLTAEGTQTGVSAWVVGNVYDDPCHRGATPLDPTVVPPVGRLVAALANQRGVDVSTPTDTRVDGYAGMYLERTVPTGTKLTDCDGNEFRPWLGTDGGPRYILPGQIDLLWIVDVDGVPLVIDAAIRSPRWAHVRAELLQVVESIRIDPR